jgi:hypothetical protein
LNKTDLPEVIQAHKQNLSHKNVEIRQTAAEALLNLNDIDEVVLRVLQINASVGNPGLQQRAQTVLHEWETPNKEALASTIRQLGIFKPTLNAGKVDNRIHIPGAIKLFLNQAKQRADTTFASALPIIQSCLFSSSAVNTTRLVDEKDEKDSDRNTTANQDSAASTAPPRMPVG